MRAMALLMITTILLVPLSGCTEEGDESSSNEGDWINQSGEGVNDWNLSLNDNQWLEIKSAIQIFEYNAEPNYPFVYSMPILINFNTSKIGTDTVIMHEDYGYSPYFAGDYHSCEWINDGYCVDPSSLGDIPFESLIEWSIIYRIHEV